MSLRIVISALIIAITSTGSIAAESAAAGWGTPESGTKAQQKTTTKATKAPKTTPKPKAASSGTTQTGASASSATKAATNSAAPTTGQANGAPSDPVAAAKDTVSAWKEKHDELWRGQ